MLTTDNELPEEEKYTYCPECGKLMEVGKSDNINLTMQCVLCYRKYRPRF